MMYIWLSVNGTFSTTRKRLGQAEESEPVGRRRFLNEQHACVQENPHEGISSGLLMQHVRDASNGPQDAEYVGAMRALFCG